eukprot:Gb_39844 [translate_table: standard]
MLKLELLRPGSNLSQTKQCKAVSKYKAEFSEPTTICSDHQDEFTTRASCSLGSNLYKIEQLVRLQITVSSALQLTIQLSLLMRVWEVIITPFNTKQHVEGTKRQVARTQEGGQNDEALKTACKMRGGYNMTSIKMTSVIFMDFAVYHMASLITVTDTPETINDVIQAFSCMGKLFNH